MAVGKSAAACLVEVIRVGSFVHREVLHTYISDWLVFVAVEIDGV